MFIISKNIKIPKTARYHIMGEISEKIKSVWIVLHGYSQLAEEFIKYFRPLNNESTLVIAPEALNRFYVKGFSGKVGAAWMTKEERENEIADYVNYLDVVYDEVIKYSLLENVKVTLLGFSQGAATSCRWMAKGRSKMDRLILWGGEIPNDIEPLAVKKIFSPIELTVVLGDKDEFISEEQLIKQTQKLDELKIHHTILSFKGRHEINAEVLRQLI